jgi:hypothetical protein
MALYIHWWLYVQKNEDDTKERYHKLKSNLSIVWLGKNTESLLSQRRIFDHETPSGVVNININSWLLISYSHGSSEQRAVVSSPLYESPWSYASTYGVWLVKKMRTTQSNDMALTTSGTELPLIRQLFSRRTCHLGVTDATICNDNHSGDAYAEIHPPLKNSRTAVCWSFDPREEWEYRTPSQRPREYAPTVLGSSSLAGSV